LLLLNIGLRIEFAVIVPNGRLEFDFRLTIC
jgi:hypothetical protein